MKLLRFLGKSAAYLGAIGLMLGIVAAGGVAFALYHYSRDLPDYRALADYEPPTVTRIHAADGRLMAEYAREKRVFLPLDQMPEHLIQAFLAAEDKNFYQHFGLDMLGILRAVRENIDRARQNLRPQGASTITQQVAKNFLLTNEVSIERKIKEAILALRIERAFSKDHILELYLNEIFLGMRSYGVAAASLSYFNKAVGDLTLAEAAYLAALPKAPSRYDPISNHDEAVARRNWVIGRMEIEGFITPDEAEAARAAPLKVEHRSEAEIVRADFFTEEVRRQLVDELGEAGFYDGGLSVRTTMVPEMQRIAQEALVGGLEAYDRRHGWRGPIGAVDLSDRDLAWTAKLLEFPGRFDVDGWEFAVVLESTANQATIGFGDGTRGQLPLAGVRWTGATGVNQILSAGDVITVEWLPASGERAARYELRQPPAVDGAIVMLDPNTGRVLALSGGFAFERSVFNRATQAKRQPGSAFKPFVYLSALEAGYTPTSVIVDAPIAIDQGPGLEKWRPTNYSDTFYGPSLLRTGVEKSRNLMTVRLAQNVGMERIISIAERFGIDNGLQPFLSASLGSNEITLLELTSAYGMLVNGGKQIKPTLIDRLQDRYGETVQRVSAKLCDGCQQETWDGAPPPELIDMRAKVVDPRLAYQMTWILKGVVERGTAVRAGSAINKPLGGKTGTTNDSKDAWFIGFSPNLVVGVYVGFDQPKSLGAKETGSSVALPIFIDAMQAALADKPATPFHSVPGVRMVKIDAKTGKLPSALTETTIVEAFLPGTEPRERSTGQIGLGGDWQALEDSYGADAGTTGQTGARPGGNRVARPPVSPSTSAVSSGGLY
ncbi:MAG: penicillin-binding protein 1A [Geminicoccaceae bacterium]